jgi:hypothetical protein
MKTAKERELELNEMAASGAGREKIVALWKKYTQNDPGHWLPAQGWDFAALIRDVVRHEYGGSLSPSRR